MCKIKHFVVYLIYVFLNLIHSRFFQLMGSVFGFVSSDVKSKVEILEDYRKKENSDKFETFKTMLNYEKNEGLFKKSDYVSGSRTLLRLHRGLSELYF